MSPNNSKIPRVSAFPAGQIQYAGNESWRLAAVSLISRRGAEQRSKDKRSIGILGCVLSYHSVVGLQHRSSRTAIIHKHHRAGVEFDCQAYDPKIEDKRDTDQSEARSCDNRGKPSVGIHTELVLRQRSHLLEIIHNRRIIQNQANDRRDDQDQDNGVGQPDSPRGRSSTVTPLNLELIKISSRPRLIRERDEITFCRLCLLVYCLCAALTFLGLTNCVLCSGTANGGCFRRGIYDFLYFGYGRNEVIVSPRYPLVHLLIESGVQIGNLDFFIFYNLRQRIPQSRFGSIKHRPQISSRRKACRQPRITVFVKMAYFAADPVIRCNIFALILDSSNERSKHSEVFSVLHIRDYLRPQTVYFVLYDWQTTCDFYTVVNDGIKSTYEFEFALIETLLPCRSSNFLNFGFEHSYYDSVLRHIFITALSAQVHCATIMYKSKYYTYVFLQHICDPSDPRLCLQRLFDEDRQLS